MCIHRQYYLNSFDLVDFTINQIYQPKSGGFFANLGAEVKKNEFLMFIIIKALKSFSNRNLKTIRTSNRFHNHLRQHILIRLIALRNSCVPVFFSLVFLLFTRMVFCFCCWRIILVWCLLKQLSPVFRVLTNSPVRFLADNSATKTTTTNSNGDTFWSTLKWMCVLCVLCACAKVG